MPPTPDTETISDGTKASTRNGLIRWRMVLFALVALGSMVVVGWIKSKILSEQEQFQSRIRSIRIESFHLGHRFQSELQALNSMLLRFQLSDNADEKEAFKTGGRQLQRLLLEASKHPQSEKENNLVLELEKKFQNYLDAAAPLLERGIKTVKKSSAQEIDQQINQISKEVTFAAAEWKEVQGQNLSQVFLELDGTVTSLRKLSEITIYLLLFLLLALAGAFYKAFILPLRTQLSETKATIERQEKLASLGTLATGVAHEIRNPLTAIKVRLFSLKRSLPKGYSENEDLGVIDHEIHRLEKLVRDFLEFARPATPEFKVIHSEELLNTVTNLLKKQLEAKSIRLKLENGDPALVRIDKNQIEQVLINLIQNAAESTTGPGTITLRSRLGRASLPGGETLVVQYEVSDAGKGIPVEVQEKIFDPFFSTKEGGTGLGLSIASRIVENHGGLIQCDSHTGVGTTFRILLPRWEEKHETKNSTY